MADKGEVQRKLRSPREGSVSSPFFFFYPSTRIIFLYIVIDIRSSAYWASVPVGGKALAAGYAAQANGTPALTWKGTIHNLAWAVHFRPFLEQTSQADQGRRMRGTSL